MIFKKKKDMVDIRELQKRGVVRIPKKDIVVPTNKEGFVEFGDSKPQTTTFFQPPQADTRAESERITELDNKIYKLEQRIELLEKKLDVGQSSETSPGLIGW